LPGAASRFILPANAVSLTDSFPPDLEPVRDRRLRDSVEAAAVRVVVELQ
jgi:hypothetical protein